MSLNFKTIILLVAISASCAEQNQKEKEIVPFELDDFDFPEDISGCSCYFSKSKADFDNNEYFFTADYDSLAHISVNGELIDLKLVSTTRGPHSFGDNDRWETYKNDLYTVKVKIVYKESSGYETWLNEGTVTVYRKDGQKKEQAIYGECGC